MIRIFFIGAGKLASNLAHSFSKTDVEIVGVWARNVEKSQAFGNRFGIPGFANLSAIPVDADVYFIAVSDSAVSTIKDSIPAVSGIVVHCSGMLPIEELMPLPDTGIFWPIQTFNNETYSELKKVPVVIEASSEENKRILEVLADKISGRVVIPDAGIRMKLHLAAVFVNNFSNHLYALAEKFLEENRLSIDLLKPIIEETAALAQTNSPEAIQSGPASRGDKKTIEKHLELLSNQPDLKNIYCILTESILNRKSDIIR